MGSGGGKRSRRDATVHGAVVDNVNVSVLLYVPVLSGSDAPIVCLKRTVSVSLLTGPA